MLQSVIFVEEKTFNNTCESLTEACEVEKSSSGHGEQLTQKNQERDGGEDHGKDHEGLDRLQPVWKNRLLGHREVQKYTQACDKYCDELPLSLVAAHNQAFVALS